MYEPIPVSDEKPTVAPSPRPMTFPVSSDDDLPESVLAVFSSRYAAWGVLALTMTGLSIGLFIGLVACIVS